MRQEVVDRNDVWISVVVPVFNSAATLNSLITRTIATMEHGHERFEIILVDDGSTDASWHAIADWAARVHEVVGVRLARNAGQVGAILAGLSCARGAILVTIDADLENEPEDIPTLIEEVRRGALLAGGLRKGRRRAASLRGTASWLFNKRVARLGYPFRDLGCGLNAMQLENCRVLCASGGEVTGLNFKLAVADLGGRIVELPVRFVSGGRSSYRLLDLVRAWFGVEVRIGARPRSWVLSVVGLLGVAVAARRPSTRAIAVVSASLCSGIAAALRDARKEVSRRQSPLFQIYEVVGRD